MLAYRSRFLPRFLGVWLAIGGFGWLILSLAAILAPQYQDKLFVIFQPAFFGEIALTLWLVIKGAKPPALNAATSLAMGGLGCNVSFVAARWCRGFGTLYSAAGPPGASSIKNAESGHSLIVDSRQTFRKTVREGLPSYALDWPILSVALTIRPKYRASLALRPILASS